MERSRLERLAPLTGVVSVVLVVVSFVLSGTVEYLPGGERVVTLLSDNSMRIMLGGYLNGIAAFFMIWFAGSVYSALREREGGTGRLSVIAMAGGVATAVILAAASATLTVAAQRAAAQGGISVDGAVTLYDLQGGIGGLTIPVTLAVMVEATAIGSLRTGLFPAWFGWLSTVLTLGLISPVGYLVAVLGLVWMVVVSIWLTAR